MHQIFLTNVISQRIVRLGLPTRAVLVWIGEARRPSRPASMGVRSAAWWMHLYQANDLGTLGPLQPGARPQLVAQAEQQRSAAVLAAMPRLSPPSLLERYRERATGE